MLSTVGSVSAALREAVRDSSSGADPERVLGVLGELARPDRLTGLIADVLEDPDEPARCAPVSFSHTLGFAKFVLVAGHPDFMLRLHVWHRAGRPAPTHIHNHRSHVGSAIVQGVLEKRIFVRDPAGTPRAEYREELCESEWRLRRTGVTGLRQASLSRLESGDRYSLRADVLHTIRAVSAEPTITLFLETSAVRTSTDVFVEVGESVPARSPKMPLTEAEYKRRLERILLGLR